MSPGVTVLGAISGASLVLLGPPGAHFVGGGLSGVHFLVFHRVPGAHLVGAAPEAPKSTKSNLDFSLL